MDTHVTHDSSRQKGGVTLVNAIVVLLCVVLVVSIGAVIIVGGFSAFLLKGSFDQTKNEVARVKAKKIGAALEQYRLANEYYPDSVEQLTKPDPNYENLSYLSEEAIRDPWGKAFQLDLKGLHHNEDAPDVFTTSPDGQVIGNW